MPERSAPAMAPAACTALAFDYGTRRIGVAVGQSISSTARPLESIHVRDGRPDWPAIARLIDEWQPQRLVLGLPTLADGRTHPLADPIRRFANRLGGRFKLPVSFIDEALSSREAADELGLADDDDAVHAHAARVILESWFATAHD